MERKQMLAHVVGTTIVIVLVASMYGWLSQTDATPAPSDHWVPPALWAPGGWVEQRNASVEFDIGELDGTNTQRIGLLEFLPTFGWTDVSENLSIATLDIRVCNQGADEGILLWNLTVAINSATENRTIATFEWLRETPSPIGVGYCRTLHQTIEVADRA